MGYSVTTLSTAAYPATSTPIQVDRMSGKPVTISLTVGSTGSVGTAVIQFSLQDVTSSAYNPGQAIPITPTAPVWQSLNAAGPFNVQGLSSAVLSSAGYPAITFLTSVIDGGGLTLTSLSPVAGLRLSSTAGSTPITLTALSGIGW